MLPPRVARWASLLDLGVCFGEATNPGPAWSLSVRNVVSAHKHSSELNDSSCCKVWTETSATSSTQRQIRNLAKQSKAYCSFSAPTSFRVHNDLVQVGRGEASGVLCYTPGQKQSTLQGSWDPVVWAAGRVSHNRAGYPPDTYHRRLWFSFVITECSCSYRHLVRRPASLQLSFAYYRLR